MDALIPGTMKPFLLSALLLLLLCLPLTQAIADPGDAMAWFQLGQMYETGSGVSRDQSYEEAVHMYNLAASQGLADAQNALGRLFASGQGVPQDFTEAVKWFQLASAQNFAEAQSNLGEMYDRGLGVPQNYGEAMRLYRLAAYQGVAYAKERLAILVRLSPVPRASKDSLSQAGKTSPSNANANASIEVALADSGGTFGVPVLINDAIKLNFTIDSGAADVVIPADVFRTLSRMGTVTTADFGEVRTYTLANGTTIQSQTFRIRSLKVGDEVLENVAGSVGPADGMLLLGQTFLRHFKSWSIDNSRHALVLTPN